MEITTRRQRVWDIVERVCWTLLQAGIGEAIVQAAGLPQAWVVPIAGTLALIKTALASKFGAASAATLPKELDAGAVP